MSDVRRVQPSSSDGADTHTGSYESDFRLLKTDLVASFNQWRRHLTFRTEGFCCEGGDDGGDEAEAGGEGSCRFKYGLARGKEIRYHTYQVCQKAHVGPGTCPVADSWC